MGRTLTSIPGVLQRQKIAAFGRPFCVWRTARSLERSLLVDRAGAGPGQNREAAKRKRNSASFRKITLTG